MSAPVWKGQLSYAGRSFAAKIITGPRSESFSFNQLHAADLSRVKQVLFCAAEDKAIPRAELVKGYEHDPGQFIVLDEAEVKGLAPDAPAIIELKKFVHLGDVDPLYIESSYYVVPGADGEPAYSALFGALRRTGLGGIAVLSLYSRERPILFRAGKSGIVAHALFYAHELRSVEQFRTDEKAAARLDVIAAAKDLRSRESDFDYLEYPDLQRQRTEALIQAKIRSKAAPAEQPGKPPADRPKTVARP